VNSVYFTVLLEVQFEHGSQTEFRSLVLAHWLLAAAVELTQTDMRTVLSDQVSGLLVRSMARSSGAVVAAHCVREGGVPLIGPY
jgi:hypothetical protein